MKSLTNREAIALALLTGYQLSDQEMNEQLREMDYAFAVESWFSLLPETKNYWLSQADKLLTAYVEMN